MPRIINGTVLTPSKKDEPVQKPKNKRLLPESLNTTTFPPKRQKVKDKPDQQEKLSRAENSSPMDLLIGPTRHPLAIRFRANMLYMLIHYTRNFNVLPAQAKADLIQLFREKERVAQACKDGVAGIAILLRCAAFFNSRGLDHLNDSDQHPAMSQERRTEIQNQFVRDCKASCFKAGYSFRDKKMLDYLRNRMGTILTQPRQNPNAQPIQQQQPLVSFRHENSNRDSDDEEKDGEKFSEKS